MKVIFKRILLASKLSSIVIKWGTLLPQPVPYSSLRHSNNSPFPSMLSINKIQLLHNSSAIPSTIRIRCLIFLDAITELDFRLNFLYVITSNPFGRRSRVLHSSFSTKWDHFSMVCGELSICHLILSSICSDKPIHSIRDIHKTRSGIFPCVSNRLTATELSLRNSWHQILGLKMNKYFSFYFLILIIEIISSLILTLLLHIFRLILMEKNLFFFLLQIEKTSKKEILLSLLFDVKWTTINST